MLCPVLSNLVMNEKGREPNMAKRPFAYYLKN
ncbi:hypothetical protein D104_06510 [Marinomonas profundimaris]|uniref:Uncharacterized protein n=1 Tax=Marinomonas profundimaris TaxID=1208321 RepID=W1S209_9GAMM|nr:hypothetical protein D104_06510 [Marinomonas profundimaris]